MAIDRRRFKGISIFKIVQEMIKTELSGLEEYIQETSRELRSKQEKLEEDYQEAKNAVEDTDEFDLEGFFEEDANRYFHVFPLYTHNPLLLIIYGQFEAWLSRLCEFEHRKKISRVEVDHFTGRNYIEKSKLYLHLIGEIDFTPVKAEWERICLIQQIRNLIAHNKSSIVKNHAKPVKEQPMFQVISKEAFINLDEQTGDFYIKEAAFLTETIEVVKRYLYFIIEQQDKEKVIAKNMSTPYNNDVWGREKSGNALEVLIGILDSIDFTKSRTDVFREEDFIVNLQDSVATALNFTSKLYAFFCDAPWEPNDVGLLMTKRKVGLAELKEIYRVETTSSKNS